jgi:hypothetical protein
MTPLIDSKYCGSLQRHVQIAGEGEIDDEIGYIEAQLNSFSQPPSQLRTTLVQGILVSLTVASTKAFPIIGEFSKFFS